MKPELKGVYFLRDGSEIVYVGSSDNIYRRIPEHLRGVGHTKAKKFTDWDYIEVSDTDEMLRLEYFFIKLAKPKYNTDTEGFGKNRPKYKLDKHDSCQSAGFEKSIYDAFEAYKISFSCDDCDQILRVPRGTCYQWFLEEKIPKDQVVHDPLGLFGGSLRVRIKIDYILSVWSKINNKQMEVV